MEWVIFLPRSFSSGCILWIWTTIAILIKLKLTKHCSSYDPLRMNHQILETITVATIFGYWYYHDSWLVIFKNLLVRLLVNFFLLSLKVVAGTSGFCFFSFQTQFLIETSSRQLVFELIGIISSLDVWSPPGFVLLFISVSPRLWQKSWRRNSLGFNQINKSWYESQ